MLPASETSTRMLAMTLRQMVTALRGEGARSAHWVLLRALRCTDKDLFGLCGLRAERPAPPTTTPAPQNSSFPKRPAMTYRPNQPTSVGLEWAHTHGSGGLGAWVSVPALPPRAGVLARAGRAGSPGGPAARGGRQRGLAVPSPSLSPVRSPARRSLAVHHLSFPSGT